MTTERLALVMIVRNEGRRLSACLDSAKDAVDEIIIVDTGSTDNTVSIARQYTQRVYSYQWQDDFAAARNFALSLTTCEWVLSLDADEVLSNTSGIRSLITNSDYTAFYLPLHALKNEDNMLEYDRFMVLRLFRSNYRFHGSIHEFIKVDPPAAIGQSQLPVIVHIPISTDERHHRRNRNIRLLKNALKKNSADPCLHYYLGTEWLGLGRIDTGIGFFRQALNQLSFQQETFRTCAIRHLIHCYKSTGQLDEGLYLCLEESQNYPEYCDLFFDGGVLFELKEEYSIALKWFEEAVKLSEPPLSFFHTDGTNSYLAYYHLGFCAEKLGLYKEAQHYYEEALAANSAYYYPLYPLVLLKLTHQSAGAVLDFLRTSGHLACGKVAVSMAELFWTAGFPDIALTCLEETACGQPASIELLARCQFYTGKTDCALQSLSQLRLSSCELAADIVIDEISALLLIGRFTEAQQRVWSLWRSKSSRDSFWAAFSLYKKLAHNRLITLPNPHSAAALLALAERCAHNKAAYSEQKSFARIVTTISELLHTRADYWEMQINDLNKKEAALKQHLTYTFAACRDLVQ